MNKKTSIKAYKVKILLLTCTFESAGYAHFQRAIEDHLTLTHNVTKDSSSQTVDVHVLQKSVRVLNWRNITWKIFYGGLRQEKQTFETDI